MTASLLIQLLPFSVEAGLGKRHIFLCKSMNYLPIEILKCVTFYLHKQVHSLLKL